MAKVVYDQDGGAIAADSGASFLVVANGLRWLKF